MTFTIFRRHNRETCDSKNRYDPRCGCPLHVQFVWKNGNAVFEGKKLTYQNKWSLGTRSWSEAQSNTKNLEKRLKDFAEGSLLLQRRNRVFWLMCALVRDIVAKSLRQLLAVVGENLRVPLSARN